MLRSGFGKDRAVGKLVVQAFGMPSFLPIFAVKETHVGCDCTSFGDDYQICWLGIK